MPCLRRGPVARARRVAVSRYAQSRRNFLYLEMLRVLKDKKPKFFIAENVKGLLSLEKGAVINMILKDFQKIGYKVDYRLLLSSDYGIPQNRERVFIIGNRIGKENPFPNFTHGLKNNLFNPKLKPHVSTKDVIEHLFTKKSAADSLLAADCLQQIPLSTFLFILEFLEFSKI